MPDQTIDRQRSGAADQDRQCHEQQRQRVFDAASRAVFLREKKTVAPVAEKQGEGDKNRQAKRHWPDQETERHGDYGGELDHQSKNSHRDGDVVFIAPVGHLRLGSFAAVPTQGMLRAVHEKRQR